LITQILLDSILINHAFAHKKYQPLLAHHQAQRLICATPITIFNPQFLRDCYQYNPSGEVYLVLRDQ